MAVEEFDDIAELGPDTPAGAGSRRRSAAKSRSRREPNRKRRMIIFGCVAIGVVGAIVYSTVSFVTHDARFRLNAVQVQGSKYVTAVEIEDKFTGDKERSVMTVPLQRRRMQVEQIPWVRSASVRRILPNSVVVTVSERVPVAFVAGEDGVSLIDEDGVVLDAPKRRRSISRL